MINRDYILRMIEQLSRFLQRSLLLKDAKQHLEAVTEVHKAGKMFLGLNPEAMGALSDNDLIHLWRVAKDLDAEKCALAAQIFKAEGEIYEDQGDNDKAVAAYLKSLSLLTETINFLKEKIPHELIASVDFFSEHLDFTTLPFPLQQKVFTTYAVIGRFAKAEDLLFEMVKEDPSFAAEGKRFYEQILKLPDQDLVLGNLPRPEALASLAEIKKHIRSW
jgi:tetratricopeptide (TPR) repeat protein